MASKKVHKGAYASNVADHDIEDEELAETQHQQSKWYRKSSPIFWFASSILLAMVLATVIIILVIASRSNPNDQSNNNGISYETSISTGLIMTNQGLMQGNVLLGDTPDDNKTWIFEFLGVRYANSVDGNNRFKPATVYNESWIKYSTRNYTFSWDATHFRASCIQYRDSIITQYLYPTISEDCLFLNIWTPYIPTTNTDSSSSSSPSTTWGSNSDEEDEDENEDEDNDDDVSDDELLPVILFIHGGGYTSGSSRLYNGSYLVRNGGLKSVFISINYRLGIFGFLQMEELYDEGISGDYGFNWPSYGGMNGINDQIIAIKWVKDNIAKFGGDPERITVFGESAGALSVCQLLITNNEIMDNDLLYQAIIDSGPCIGPWGPLQFDFGLGLNTRVLEDGTIYGNINDLETLRSLTADELLEHVQGSNITAGNWVPTVDKHLLTDNATILFENIIQSGGTKMLNAKRILWGFDSQDGVSGWPYFSGHHPTTIAEFESILMSALNDSSIVDDILNVYYPISDFSNNVSVAYYGMNGDLCVVCPTFELANKLTDLESNSQTSVEQFMFEFEGSRNPYLAPHFAEMIFLFDFEPIWAEYYRIEYNQSLSDAMVSAWNNFASLGDAPSNFTFEISNYNHIGKDESINFEWNRYGKGEILAKYNKSVLLLHNIIDNSNAYEQTFRHGACPFWKNYVSAPKRRQLCLGETFLKSIESNA